MIMSRLLYRTHFFHFLIGYNSRGLLMVSTSYPYVSIGALVERGGDFV